MDKDAPGEIVRYIADLRQVRQDVAVVHANLGTSEVIRQLQVHQLRVVRLASNGGSIEEPEDGMELPAWSDLYGALERTHPGIPRRTDIADGVKTGEAGQDVYNTPPERVSLWIAATVAVIDALIRHVEDSGNARVDDRWVAARKILNLAEGAFADVETWRTEERHGGKREYVAPPMRTGPMNAGTVRNLFVHHIASLTTHPSDLPEDKGWVKWLHETYPDADERVFLNLELGLVAGAVYATRSATVPVATIEDARGAMRRVEKRIAEQRRDRPQAVAVANKMSTSETGEPFTYPTINALFHAIIHVECNLIGLGTMLRDDLSRRRSPGFDRHQYVPPASVVTRMTGREPSERDSQLRAIIEAHPLTGVVEADNYWRWWMQLRDLVDSARMAVEAARGLLDEGEPNLLKRASTQVLEALLGAEGTTNHYYQHGWSPFAFPPDSHTRMFDAAGKLAEWVERLRPIANMVGSAAITPQKETNLPSHPPPAKNEAPTQYAAGDDFTWIIFAGQKYDFTKGLQAEAVRHLWQEWEKGGRRNGCGMSEKTIGERCGSSSNDFRLQHLFRKHRAWGTIIKPTTKGCFALHSVESRDNHTS